MILKMEGIGFIVGGGVAVGNGVEVGE